MKSMVKTPCQKNVKVLTLDFLKTQCGDDLSFPSQTLGVNLVWRSASEGVTVSVDMTVTLFNKEQFAENRWEVLPR